MKRRRHTPEQFVRKLAEADRLLGQGQQIEEVRRHLEITELTFYRFELGDHQEEVGQSHVTR